MILFKHDPKHSSVHNYREFPETWTIFYSVQETHIHIWAWNTPSFIRPTMHFYISMGMFRFFLLSLHRVKIFIWRASREI